MSSTVPQDQDKTLRKKTMIGCRGASRHSKDAAPGLDRLDKDLSLDSLGRAELITCGSRK